MDFVIQWEDLISMLVSVICGGILGVEREYKNKSTGLRTIILICLGSTIFTIVSRYGVGADDRVSANIITGIGFIGAGVIFKDKLGVLGLTTAAVIWTTAGIGMTTGIGYHALAFLFTVITLLILVATSKVEKLINRLQKHKVISITFSNGGMQSLTELEELMKQNGVGSKRIQISKVNNSLNVVLKVAGNEKQMIRLTEELATNEHVSDFY